MLEEIAPTLSHERAIMVIVKGVCPRVAVLERPFDDLGNDHEWGIPLIETIRVKGKNTTQGLQRSVIEANFTGTMLYSFRRHYTYKNRI
jgi:hypothetical protein